MASMPVLESARLGPVEFEPEQVIRFPAGLPGFESEKDFLLLERAELRPLFFLQSIVTPALCFLLLPAAALEPGYQLALGPDDYAALEVGHGEEEGEVAVLAVLTVPDEGSPTANLLAPVVIDLAARRGVQAVRGDNTYSYCHPVEVLTCS
jgi:flagellar assembly factor FliW